ncbi:MAG: hypothetical protein U1F68_14935 [Gammaproteobacteria bacterium]
MDDTEVTLTDPDGKAVFHGTADALKATARRIGGQLIPEATLQELERCYQEAADYADAYRDAIKAQAEKYKLDAKVLRRVVQARAKNKVDELRDEVQLTLDLLPES